MISSGEGRREIRGAVKDYLLTLLILAVFCAGFATGNWSGSAKPESREDHSLHQESAASTLWTCSMHPAIKLPSKGKCPICFMDLIPLAQDSGSQGKMKGDESHQGTPELSLDSRARTLMELETAPVQRFYPQASVSMVGKVAFDETRISTISAWIPGRLERLFVNYTGIAVRRGDHMVEIYSPALLTAQEELIQALKGVRELAAQASALIRNSALATLEAARRKLLLMGLTAEQIRALEKSDAPRDRLTITAPAGGIVVTKAASEGMYVQTGTPIYTIADLSRVWVALEAYERDLNWVRYGSTVEFTTETWPGRTFQGTVSFVEPVVDPATRTSMVRLTVDNSSMDLKPGMFVRATLKVKVGANGPLMMSDLKGKWISPMHPEVIKDTPGKCDVCGMPLVRAESLGYVPDKTDQAPLVIPSSALLRTGRRAIVYVRRDGQGNSGNDLEIYQGRQVVPGPALGEWQIILSGLSEGERVVTRGAFKIDAELQIRDLPSMMSPDSQEKPEEAMAMKPEMVINDGMSMNDGMKMPDSFSKTLESFISDYLATGEALAGDSPDKAAAAAGKALETLNTVDSSHLDPQGARLWKGHHGEIERALGLLASEQGLDRQREAFFALSKELISCLAVMKPSVDGIREAYCPMAFGDTGATWLQRGDEISNPYFGDMMLRCGEFRRTLGARP